LRRWPETRRALLSAAALFLCGAAARAPAEELRPWWEFGLGIGAYVFNDYRGSRTTHAYPIPVPYLIYRGEILKSDREGPKVRFLKQKRLEFTLSVNATTPVINDSVRHGMPDLEPTLEAGASLNAHLWRSDDERLKLDLRLPVRAAVTVQASPRMIGVFAAPHLSLDIAQLRGASGWKLGLLAGPLFADRRYNDYFYSVAPQYARPDRPAYEAHGGYAGTQTLLALTRRFPAYWVGAYVRHDLLGGATFADSPLVKTNSYWSGGLGITWIIRQSTRQVESED